MNISKKEIADRTLAALKTRYPKPDGLLEHEDAWELLVATVLAAQCTDARVNMVTPILFAKWPRPKDLAMANVEEIEEVIHSTGFYKNKAKNIKAAGKLLHEKFAGQVPPNMEELITIPGVARKTANVVLWGAFGINQGLAVDTHVKRICYRLGLTQHQDPVRVEKDLMELFAEEEWGNVNNRMVWFGRHICDARKPKCTECEMTDFCPKR